MTNEIQVFNRKLMQKRRDIAAATITDHDFIINLAADYIVERLEDEVLLSAPEKNVVSKQILDFGCHNGQLGAKIIEAGLGENIIYCDYSVKMLEKVNGLKILADEEYLPFGAKTFDLIVSSMSLHWVNDLPGCLLQLRGALKPGGIFIAAMPGIATLQELRHCLMEAEMEITGGIAPHISPFTDVKSMGQLLGRAGFANPVADSEMVKVSYPNMFSLMKDIKKMGEANALIKRSNYLRRDVLALAGEKYQEFYGDDEGGIVATIDIITITGLAG